MAQLFETNDGLFIYEPRSNFISEVTMSEIESLNKFFDDPEYDLPIHLKELIDKKIFVCGKAENVAPLYSDLDQIIDYQCNAYIPRKLTIEVTENCNLRCRYCLFSNQDESKRKHTDITMTEEIAYSAIDYYFKV